MNVSEYSRGIVALIIGIVLAAAIFIPVISEAQDLAGDPVEKSNFTYNAYYREYAPGDVLAVNASGVTLNGETILNASARPLICSDGLYSSLTSTNPTYTIFADSSAFAQDANSEATFTFTESSVLAKVIVEGVEKTREESFTWAMILCNESGGDYTLTNSSSPHYLRHSDNYYCAAYNFTENTFYAFNQSGGTSNIEVTPSEQIASGTTDIYSVTFSCKIGSTTFAPEYLIVPLEVQGHADSGATYSLIGILPLLVFVGLVLAAIGMFIRSRAE